MQKEGGPVADTRQRSGPGQGEAAGAKEAGGARRERRRPMAATSWIKEDVCGGKEE